MPQSAQSRIIEHECPLCERVNERSIIPIPKELFTVPEEGWVQHSYWCKFCEKIVGFYHQLHEDGEVEVFDTFTLTPRGVEYARSLSERSTIDYFVEDE